MTKRPSIQVAPTFTYHFNPIRTGIISTYPEAICSSCNETRTLFYDFYDAVYSKQSTERPTSICAWCVADGSAAKKYSLRFISADCLSSKRLPASVLEEFECRTPTYLSCHSMRWLCHCNDACVFHGDLSKEEVANPNWEAVADFLSEAPAGMTWEKIAEYYVPSDPSIFKFACRHCNAVFYQLDTYRD